MLSCMDVPWLEVCKAGKGADHTVIVIVCMGAGALVKAYMGPIAVSLPSTPCTLLDTTYPHLPPSLTTCLWSHQFPP